MSLARPAAVLALSLLLSPAVAQATPYASGITVSGGVNVNFILNEAADSLTYSINGGAPVSLTTSAGAKSFALGSSTDTFSIVAQKTDSVGYAVLTGGTIASATNGLSTSAKLGGFRLVSNDSNPLTRYNSPRGVSVSTNPNAPQFGTAYIANSAAGTTTGVVRTLGDGLYAVKADVSDAFLYGNTAQDPSNRFDGAGASANSPWRLTVAANGEVYAPDFSDANGNVYRLNPTLTTSSQLLTTVGGTAPLPAGRNHGSVTGAYIEGSSTDGNLVLYTIDEDITTNYLTGAGSTTDQNSLWRYNIGGAAVPFSGQPTKINATNELVPLATSDLDRGLDGKFYLAQNRTDGAQAGVFVLDANGVTVFNSLTASRALLGNASAPDILRNVQAMAVSPDQKWLAVMLNNSDVAVMPLVNGIPSLAEIRVVDTGTDVNSGRDIAFDAAGNIHYVSSGQALYRILSSGGLTTAITSWNGSSYNLQVALSVPESKLIALAGSVGLGVVLLVRRRRSAAA